MKKVIIIVFLFSSLTSISQIYPSFGPEIDVTINGLSFDAMEPFISPNGNYLFFNSLNDGINTKIFYATNLDDSTFNFFGELNGTNQITPPHLDAVPDMDSLNNFYWTSTRNYPIELNNLFHGTFNNGNVTNIGRVDGNFNKNTPGWLVMDHGISYDGQFLYYNNARFDDTTCAGPCETEIGIAQKVNDSTFNKIANSDIMLQSIMDTNYNYYAPCISSDNLELYYTRYLKDNVTPSTLFEICVAVRNSPIDTFSSPMVLVSEPATDLIEAATLTADKQIMYYHRKIPGSHKIVMRYRKNPLGIDAKSNSKLPFTIYPNPSNEKLNIKTELSYHTIIVTVYSLLWKPVLTVTNKTEIDVNSLSSGAYYLMVNLDNHSGVKKLLIN
ncbi:MAG: T9SS type A sorting domain-containing protein [Cytophagales bacterium]